MPAVYPAKESADPHAGFHQNIRHASRSHNYRAAQMLRIFCNIFAQHIRPHAVTQHKIRKVFIFFLYLLSDRMHVFDQRVAGTAVRKIPVLRRRRYGIAVPKMIMPDGCNPFTCKKLGKFRITSDIFLHPVRNLQNRFRTFPIRQPFHPVNGCFFICRQKLKIFLYHIPLLHRILRLFLKFFPFLPTYMRLKYITVSSNWKSQTVLLPFPYNC